MFQLTKKEDEILRSQIGISKQGRGGRRYTPHVFTEQGVAMLSSAANSKRAISINGEWQLIYIVNLYIQVVPTSLNFRSEIMLSIHHFWPVSIRAP